MPKSFFLGFMLVLGILVLKVIFFFYKKLYLGNYTVKLTVI